MQMASKLTVDVVPLAGDNSTRHDQDPRGVLVRTA